MNIDHFVSVAFLVMSNVCSINVLPQRRGLWSRGQIVRGSEP